MKCMQRIVSNGSVIFVIVSAIVRRFLLRHGTSLITWAVIFITLESPLMVVQSHSLLLKGCRHLFCKSCSLFISAQSIGSSSLCCTYVCCSPLLPFWWCCGIGRSGSTVPVLTESFIYCWYSSVIVVKEGLINVCLPTPCDKRLPFPQIVHDLPCDTIIGLSVTLSPRSMSKLVGSLNLGCSSAKGGYCHSSMIKVS